MAAPGNPVSFLPPEPERTMTPRTWMIAALSVLLLIGIAAVATLHGSANNTGALLSADSYAGSLPISNVTMTEATNTSGMKSTYIDGTVSNTGDKVVTDVVVQVSFTTNDGTAPHREAVPLMLIRTREPYVDLEPVSAEPLKPGEHHDFRLIFETVPANWDVKPPAIQIVHTEFK